MKLASIWIWALFLLACGRASEPSTAAGSAGSAAASARKACVATAECESACKAGDGAACTVASERYFEGKNEHRLDMKLAYELAKRACDLNSAHGCALLGFTYQDGLGTEWAPKLAIEAYGKACRLGAGVGCFNLATIYEGHGVDADMNRSEDFFLRAQEHWNRACEGDEPRWCTNAAYMVSRQAKNKPTETELERMLALDKRTCESGWLVGCVEAVRVQEDLKRIDAAAITVEMEKLCTAGEPTACTTAAMRILDDAERMQTPATDPRHARGIELLERACKIGDKYGCSAVAFEYIRAKHTTQDFAKAERLYEQACDRGLSTGCVMMAKKYRGVPQRVTEAASFARRGCQMGLGEPCQILAELTFAGEGVAKSEDDGLKWSREACQHGNLSGCKTLAVRDMVLPVLAEDLPKVHDALCKDGVTSSCAKAKP